MKCSDIVSLSSLKKEQKEIYILGRLEEDQYYTDTSKPAVEALKTSLENLYRAPCKTAFLFFFPQHILIKFKDSFTKPNIYSYCVQTACKTNFQCGNVDYLTQPLAKNYELELHISTLLYSLFNPQIFSQALAPIKLPVNTLLELEQYLNDRPEVKKIFFSAKGMFNKHMKPVFKQNNRGPSIENYLTLLASRDREIMSAPDNTITALIKKEWTISKDKTRAYLKLQSATYKHAVTLREVVLISISEKKSFTTGIEEFERMVLNPLAICTLFDDMSLFLKALAVYDKIIFCYHFSITKDFINYLEEIGFKSSNKGYLQSVQETQILTIEKNVFTDEELADFFLLLTNATSPLADTLPLNHHESSTYFTFFNPDLNCFSEKPFNDYVLKVCHMCNQTLETYNACATTEIGVYCSLTCMLNKLFQEEKTSHKLSLLLNENHVLSQEEKLILKQFGALSYLRAALLMPSITQEYGIVYQLPLSSIINALKLIETTAKDPQTPWGETLQLAQHWGIRMPDLTLFLSAYKITKHNYLQALLKDSLYKKYSDLLGEHHTLFDQKGSCTTLQKVAFTNIKKFLNLGVTTKDISILFLYNDLIEQINKRVGLPIESINDLLAVTHPHQDLTKILQFIGYAENPFTSKKNKKDRVILPSLIDKTLEDEKSLEENVEEGSFIQETSLLNPLHTINSCEETDFETVTRRQKKVIRTLKSSFAGCKPYTISLFKARKFVTQELQKAQKVWKQCKKTVESHRIKTLLALADILQDQNPVIKLNSFGCLALECKDTNYDDSITEKLDLHHLFTRLVDTCLPSYGIAERFNNLMQVSIPGEITDDQGTKKVGFFQYSFTSDSWVCIHRCFKSYDANQNDTYISTSLRKILFDFLKEYCDTDEYKKVIEHLEYLIAQGK
ncbi:hypothetical protein H0X06_05030 [Candidatus Dependentiae bacterium]|nr:hypothetical protein [Candidatus Dependentiae bacterium]